MQTNLAVEQNKNIRWFESPWNQSGRRGKDLPTSHVLSSEWRLNK